jgi:hypothetical protein
MSWPEAVVKVSEALAAGLAAWAFFRYVIGSK